MQFRNLVAALSTASAIGFVVINVGADMAVRSTVRKLVVDHPGVAVGGMRLDLWSGSVTLRDIRVSSGAVAITIGSLRLPLQPLTFSPVSSASAASLQDLLGKGDVSEGLSKALPGQMPPFPSAPRAPIPSAPRTPIPIAPPRATSAPTASGSAVAENVVIKIDNNDTVRIPRIDVFGTTLTNANLAALVDPSSPEDIESRLRRLTAAAIIIPQIGIENGSGAPASLIQKQIVLADIVAGRARVLGLRRLAFADQNPREPISFDIAAVSATNIDLAQIAHLLKATGRGATEKRARVFDSFVVDGIKLLLPKKDLGVSIASLKGNAFSMRPLPGFASARSDRVLAGLADAIELGGLEVDDLTARSPMEPSGLRAFSIKQFGLKGYDRSSLGGGILRGLRLEGTFGRISLGLLGLEGLVVPLPPRGGMQPTPAPTLRRLDIADLDVNVMDPTKPPSAHAPPVHLTLDRAAFANEGDAPGAIPRLSTATIDHLAFDVPLNNDATALIYRMGYGHLDLSATARTSYDAADLALRIEKLQVSGENVGSVTLKLDALNVTPQIISTASRTQQAAVMAALLKRVVIDIRNDGIVEKIRNEEAAARHKTPDQIRDEEMDFVSRQVPEKLGNNAQVKMVVDVVAKFLRAPRKLHISVVSKGGFGAGSVALVNAPDVLLSTLDVDATANE